MAANPNFLKPWHEVPREEIEWFPSVVADRCGVAPSPQMVAGPVAGIDVAEHLLTKVRAAQCHVSQHPPFSGPPEEEAARMACHEYFTLARPNVTETSFSDLFTPLSNVYTQERKQ